MPRRPNIQPGDRITVHYPTTAYYAEQVLLEPGMVGTVVAIAPKARIVGAPPVHDRHDEFLVVDFLHPETGQKYRTSVNFCNAKKVKA